jgi:Predicted acyl-CoA transferases/carnitine dehydratase
MVLLLGVLSAVFHAKSTGEGQVVDTAITDGSAYISTLLRMMHNTGQLSDEAGSGWSDYGSPWNDNYPCADGHYISICALEPQFYALLMDKLGLADHPVFANQWDKSQWPEGKRIIAEIFKGKTREQWCDLLEGTDACFAPVLNMSEATEHPHNKARGTFTTVDGVLQPSPAPSFSRTTTTPGRVPYAGQHSTSLLVSLGYDDQGISQLREQGVI